MAILASAAGRASQLDLFRSNLPRRPYCADDLHAGLVIRGRMQALEHAYIQHNPPALVHWIVVDVDRPEAGAAAIDAGLPEPAWIAVNPENGHAHLSYGLAAPVCRSEAGLIKPLKLAAAIERGLVAELGGDPGYAGLVTKNPNCPRWRVIFPRSAGVGLYELGELAEYVPMIPAPAANDCSGLGRNCSLFARLRKWSYRAIRQGWPEFGRWHMACLDRAHALNRFAEPLPLSEVQATAKSVAKWTHQRFTPGAFSAIQSARGQRGGRPSIGDPWEAQGVSRATYYRRRSSEIEMRAAYEAKRADKLARNQARAQALRAEGLTQREIAQRMGVARSTVAMYLGGHR